MDLILASTSQYRQFILAKLGLKFSCIAPNVDETAKDFESPEALVTRLAIAKAENVGNGLERGLVIGSDQVACVENTILGKPCGFTLAKQQLQLCSGKTVRFYTGLCVYNAMTHKRQVQVDLFEVTFRELSLPQIEGYLNKEKPFDCAGSFKSEGLGVCLFEKLRGDDPNALIGLPLILLTKMLENESVDPLLL